MRVTFDDAAESYVGRGPAPVAPDADAADAVWEAFDAALEAWGETIALPTSGTFKPIEPLAKFQGEPLAGEWTLDVTDLAGDDPLCYYGAELYLTTPAPAALPAASLAGGTVGAAYGVALPLIDGVEYRLLSGALPDGVTLNAATGALSGVPTVAGTFAFEVVTVSALGVSEPRAFSILVAEAPVTAKPVSRLTIAPSSLAPKQGDTITLSVSAFDADGGAVVVPASDFVVTSDVATDVVNGLSVTFPTASPHTLTVTHAPTGVTQSVLVQVSPAGQPSGEPSGTPSGEPSGTPSGEPSGTPSGEPSGGPSGTPSGEPSGTPSTSVSEAPAVDGKTGLPATGVDLLATASLLAGAGLLVGAGVLLRRRQRA